MNFFEQQLLKRRQSLVLLLCFIVSLLLIGVTIHLSIAGASMLLGESQGFTTLSTPAVVMIAMVWFCVLLGGFFRALDVSSGGALLARRYGAVQASDRSRYEQERQLLNVVAEISIASATPKPDVFVLRNESSINAFVLGNVTIKPTKTLMRGKARKPSRHAVVITQGALDEFDRDELQALVAHEIGHISNGDLPLNMHLLVVLGGLMAIDEVGRLLTGSDPGKNLHPGVLVGFVLRAIGCFGVFFAKIIRAAFSRQREYLADATAIQFTRSPHSLASALRKIQLHYEGAALHGIYQQELAHLCFQAGRLKHWYSAVLATHPPLQSRIDAIDPHFAIKQRSVDKNEERLSERVDELRDRNSDWGSRNTHTDSEMQMASSENNTPFSAPISDRIFLLLPDDASCLAALVALFASDDTNKRRDYLNATAFAFNVDFSKKVKKILQAIPHELSHQQRAVIDHATSTLSASVLLTNRKSLLFKLERLLSVSGEYDLMNYAKLQLIRRKIGVEFPLLETLVAAKPKKSGKNRSCIATARRVKAFDAMGSEFALMLSLMVESSGASSAVQDEEFERVLRCYTEERLPRRTCKESGIIEELEAAFQTLYVQPLSIRQAFVQHCIEIAQRDNFVAQSENVLLELFAASLECETKAA